MKNAENAKKRKKSPAPETATGTGALNNFLSESIRKTAAGSFAMLPFRVFEMLRFPKTKRFFAPGISDEQILGLLPKRAAELVEDLMALESPADRLTPFQELESRSELAVEIQKKLWVQSLVSGSGFKPRAAEQVARTGGNAAPEAMRWLSEVFQSRDPRTKKMLLLLLQPQKGKKPKRQEIVDRLEFAHIPVPRAKSNDEFLRIVDTAYEALRLGFPFKKADTPAPLH